MFMPQVFNLALEVARILVKEKILSSLSICLSLCGFNIHTSGIDSDLQNVRGRKDVYSIQLIMRLTVPHNTSGELLLCL